MTSSTDQNKIGQTRRETAESKAATTKRVSEEILLAETEQRKAKTEKLRLARLAMQEEQAQSGADNPKAKPAKNRSRVKS